MLSYTPQINCSDLHEDNDVKRAVTLLIAELIMHFMPIGVVLYVYRPEILHKKHT